MSKVVSPRKCSECGKRRMPARRSNGRLSTKCKECFGGQFWLSAFGRWFAEAAVRQSPESMPFDENDIKGIYSLWSDKKKATGYRLVDEQLIPIHEYHISHRDPAKGNGFQGRFTTGNLIIATAKANQKAYNAEPIDHGFRVYTNKKPFGTPAKVKQWCGGQYDLNGIVADLELKKYSPPKKANTNVSAELLPQGKHPREMLERQVNRFEGGTTNVWRRVVMSPSEAFSDVLVYGIGLGSGELKECPDDDPELTVDDF